MTNRTILLVDDNPGDEVLVRRALSVSKIDSELIATRDGVEALDFLLGRGKHADRDSRKLPAFVLLDLKLPRVDGLEVLRLMRADARARLTPVVMFTSSQEPRDVMDAFDAGCNSYVCKPVSFEQLVQTLKQIASYWLTLNEPIPQ